MIELKDLKVKFDDFSLGPLSLEIKGGEFFVILGPTGAGKTILLETIAGIYEPLQGRILLEGRDVTLLPPEKRGIGIVYQDFSLFPHLKVKKNIEYGLRFMGISKLERRKKVQELAQMLGIHHLLNRYPLTLSGGEQQRVALARALAPQPKLMLLDEPLSALDPGIRQRLGNELKKLNQETGITFLMVTHDIKEAISLGDRIALIRDGKIEQMGRPEEFFHCPASSFVAEFFGMKNIFRAKFHEDRAQLEGINIALKAPCRSKEGFVVIRPDEIVVSRSPIRSSLRNELKAKVTSILDVGSYVEIRAMVNTVELCAYITQHALEDLKLKEGEEVFFSFKAISVEAIETL
ncbi:MAG: hypothetical protein DRG50_09720 [Deltaproteobacteria bacterium]|nr:MAG: hypothetical protein DRG50_09720 [Deltaproteobacteria bacterium]